MMGGLLRISSIKQPTLMPSLTHGLEKGCVLPTLKRMRATDPMMTMRKCSERRTLAQILALPQAYTLMMCLSLHHQLNLGLHHQGWQPDQQH